MEEFIGQVKFHQIILFKTFSQSTDQCEIGLSLCSMQNYIMRYTKDVEFVKMFSYYINLSLYNSRGTLLGAAVSMACYEY